MAEFIISKEIETEQPTIEVTIDPRNPLPVGRHRFRLVVVDDSGNTSKPDEIEVIVADQEAPTAVLTGPEIVGMSSSFELSGEKSFDTGGGVIKVYRWTYLGPVITR
ncbi:MAG TPA: hypothetical protein VHP37_19730 [Burkholderiales bacterium]|nr:hypothetical protein [Burkholderiales bacterium]